MKTAKNLSVRKAVIKGFSLVEMLVVIAIIGVIAAIAIPSISNLTDSANTSKDKRNAQNLASVYASAQAAGYDFGEDADVDSIVTALTTGSGVKITTGSFADDVFGVPGLNAEDVAGAKTFLVMTDEGVLSYVAGNKAADDEG